MADALDDFPLTWGPPPPRQNPTSLEGAGLICETARFDSFYNADGGRVVLPAGKKYKNKDVNFMSALTVTTYWDRAHEVDHTVLKIRSPHMKAALKAVVPEFSSRNIDKTHIFFEKEPWCLFQYRNELMGYGQDVQNRDSVAAQHVYHLLSYMWDVFLGATVSFALWVENPSDEPASEHRYLWMIFRPGDMVFVQDSGQAFVFEDMSLQVGDWALKGHCIDYDGDEYGYRSYTSTISFYDGVKPLRELYAVPFDRLPSAKREALREQLVARGRKFIGIQGYQYLWYDGAAPNRRSNMTSQNMGKCRFVTDCKRFNANSYSGSTAFSDNRKKFKASSAQSDMAEQELMICTTGVKGYSLRDNQWGIFDIDSIGDISFDSDAFDALMIPEDQKRQVLALVRVHEDERLTFDDLVKGKGRGMVFLLYRDPGTGKTLTAESVSDYCKKPLLRLDASTLGTSVSSVESGLTEAFSLAEKWQAIVLLDEADIYLEQRKSKNLRHNGLVSVFLRMLEYYQGILFLTTNRITSFDRAFMSRIHLALHYPPLTQPSRAELWYTFVRRSSPESAEELRRVGVLAKLAEEPLNGRQIKNLVRTASALALSGDSSSDGRLRRKHLEWALKPMKAFEADMARVFSNEEERDRHAREDSVTNEKDPNEEVEEEEYEEDEEEEEEVDEDEEYAHQAVKRRRLS